MSYARKGCEGSDVYVYLSVSAGCYCCDDCNIWPKSKLRKKHMHYLWTCARPQQMIEHLREHQAKGDSVPAHAFDRLWIEVTQGF